MKPAIKRALKRLPYMPQLLKVRDRLRNKLLQPASPASTKQAADVVADYWSDVSEKPVQFSPDVFWLGNPLVNARYTRKAVGGKPYPDWIAYCVQEYLGQRLPVERMLSLGCGDGPVERHLASMNAFHVCEGMDIAPGMIDQATKAAAAAGLNHIRYSVCNLEKTVRFEHRYDAVWFHHSLHHIKELEKVLELVARSLKPDGYLFLNEYIGPNYFGYSQREQEVLRAAHALIPRKYRRDLHFPQKEVYRDDAPIPNPADVARLDPSESVRASEIMKVLADYFDVTAFHATGGTILQFLLVGIAGNFRTSDPDSVKVLQLLFDLEDTLMAVGDLQTHFAVIVAKPKAQFQSA